jgi:hypothetical protein
VSRAGKNYLIERLIENINHEAKNTLFHVNGSSILDDLSQRLFSIPLQETDENQKNRLRLMFCDELVALRNGYRHKIVDGHYSFYKNSGFKIAFTEKDRDVYDLFFYLDTPASQIIEQANRDTVKKSVAFMSEQKLNAWKDFEIEKLRKICHAQNKEFVVLDNNIEDCVDYFETLLLGKRELILNSEKIAEHIIAEHQELINNHDNIILLDCDRTLSNNDTTYDFCKVMDIGESALKDIFAGERYSLYQFFRAAKLYSQKDETVYGNAGMYAMGKVILNDLLINDIKNNGSGYLSIGITSGIFETWQRIQERYQFPCIIAGGSNAKKDKLIVSRSVKYHLARLLRKEGKYVIAAGDSAVDLDMLEEANAGFVVVQEKINGGFEKYFKHTKSNIMQLEYNKFYYDDSIIKRSLFV